MSTSEVLSAKRRKMNVAETDSDGSRQVLAGTGKIAARPMLNSSHFVISNSTKSSNFADFDSLRAVLRREGYIFLKAFLPRKDVKLCREACVEYVRKLRGAESNVEADIMTVPKDGDVPVRLLDKVDLQQAPDVKLVLEHERLFKLMKGLMSTSSVPPKVSTVDYKWLRAVPTNQFTGLHTDRVYMGSSAPSMLTCWIPLGDIPAHQGTLLILRGSNTDPRLDLLRSKYGCSQVGPDGVQSGWLSENPNDLPLILVDEYEFPESSVNAFLQDRWVCSDMEMGDVIVLSLDTLHISTTNTTDKLRLSADTRWFLSDDPCAFKASSKTC